MEVEDEEEVVVGGDEEASWRASVISISTSVTWKTEIEKERDGESGKNSERWV